MAIWSHRGYPKSLLKNSISNHSPYERFPLIKSILEFIDVWPRINPASYFQHELHALLYQVCHAWSSIVHICWLSIADRIFPPPGTDLRETQSLTNGDGKIEYLPCYTGSSRPVKQGGGSLRRAMMKQKTCNALTKMAVMLASVREYEASVKSQNVTAHIRQFQWQQMLENNPSIIWCLNCWNPICEHTDRCMYPPLRVHTDTRIYPPIRVHSDTCIYNLSVYIQIHVFIQLSVYIQIHVFIHLSMYIQIHVFIHLSVYIQIHVFIHLSVYILIHVFIHLSVYI